MKPLYFSATPRFVTLGVSNFDEIARWVLDRNGVAYVDSRHVPGFHVFAMLRWVRKPGVFNNPVLVTRDFVLSQHENIAEHYDALCAPEDRLLPDDPTERQATLDLCHWFSSNLGGPIARYVYFEWLPHKKLTSTTITIGVPWFEKLLVPVVYPLLGTLIRKAVGLNRDGGPHSLEEVRATFAKLDERLSDGRPYLMGDRLTLADVWCASNAAPVLLPHGFGGSTAPLDAVPEEMQAVVEELRSTATGKFVMRIYEEHRPRRTSPLAGRSDAVTNPRKMLVLGPVLLFLIAFIGLHVFGYVKLREIRVPAYQALDSVVWLDQQWTYDDWQWFYHTTQGGSLVVPIPYDWLINLEQPRVPFLLVSEVGLLTDPTYITRFGLLENSDTAYDPAGMSIKWAQVEGYTNLEQYPVNNPDRLPVGLVRTPDLPTGFRGKRADMAGLTCAACHTGQINVGGVGVRINGAPALTDLGKFRVAVGYSLAMTYLGSFHTWLPIPNRFLRFADRVLGENNTREQRAELKEWMGTLITTGKAMEDLEERLGLYPVEEGFSRLDALGRIYNSVFSELGDSLLDENLAPATAPVNYPYIWDAPWLNWVQYNASFSQSLMRNGGEAMGVYTADVLNVSEPSQLFESQMNLINLHEIESLIRGEEPFTGLRAPDWPAGRYGFPEIDDSLAQRGEGLYRQHCAFCHLPPVTDSVIASPTPGDSTYWTPEDRYGNRYLKVKTVNLWDIGTDPGTVMNFLRGVNLGPLGFRYSDKSDPYLLGGSGRDAGGGSAGTMLAPYALRFLIDKTVEKRLDDMEVADSATRDIFRGQRPSVIQAPLAYKARPLNGVWATAPFLHNGSVPTLYHLLSPVDERPDTFWLGTKEYDFKRVGYRWERPITGGFRFDTSIQGNSNEGHEFWGSSNPNAADYYRSGRRGVVGPALDENERWAIIEYLKSMPGGPHPVSVGPDGR